MGGGGPIRYFWLVVLLRSCVLLGIFLPGLIGVARYSCAEGIACTSTELWGGEGGRGSDWIC